MNKDSDGLIRCADGRLRCFWAASTPDYCQYHDEEWGFPVAEDRRLFEKICLEGFQSGLSWLTILRKRPAFRRAFDDFDFAKVARYSSRKVEALVKDAGIVRHRGKIEATINNARRACSLVEEVGSLAYYFWQFEPKVSDRPRRITREVLGALTTSAESVALSKDLRKRGWAFVGPTTVYAFMQAMGLVDDHIEGCAVRTRVEKARDALTRPER